jgi:hypothetical protein
MRKATQEQINIAKEFKIPYSQAFSINIQRVKEYREYLEGQRHQDEMFLDELEERRRNRDL